MRITPHNADRPPPRRGFTLVELMVVMAIVGVMVAMSAPSFERAIEQSRADIALANLRAVWAAERLYWLEYHKYTSDIGSLRTLGVLDTSIPTDPSDSVGGYSYSVTVDAATEETNVTATATRAGTGTGFTINETGESSGTVTISGFSITPGFQ
jgi:prepilin-type N-terminal cleavage/methylation domain-containing protein